jgi:enoyl-CoA hydratase/carnithine racemase
MTNYSWIDERWPGRVKPTPLEEYSDRYSDFFVMKREGGILELRLHTDGGPYGHNWAAHNAWNRVWQDVANDPENEVLIITGTGDRWFTAGQAKDRTPYYEESAEYVYQQMYDGQKLIQTFVEAIEIPTIAVVNGPGVHTEFALLCDITLAAEDADFMDPHFWAGYPPGDGLYLVLQELMGVKRAAYHVYTGSSLSAAEALELGLVNQVLPREELLGRAWELAEMIMLRPRMSRRLTHGITVRPWRRLVSEDLGFHLMSQVTAMLGNKTVMSPEVLNREAAERKAW